MLSRKTLIRLTRLRKFFLREVRAEAESGFSRLRRVPDSHVMRKLRFFNSLNAAGRDAFLDCCAYWSSVHYGFVAKIPTLSPTNHPFFSRWSRGPMWLRDFDHINSVPLLRATVQQYKIDRANKVPSRITKKQFDYASSVRSVKAPELRKRVRAALAPLGHFKTDEWGNYWCKVWKKIFFVNVDYGGRYAQLRYSVGRPEFKGVHPLSQFRFERAMGFGLGNWDYIVEENVDDVFSLFAEVVQYSFELPDRMRTALKQPTKSRRR